MELSHAQLSVTGPVRPINEDAVAIYVSQTQQEHREKGSAFILADGVGGQDHGEVASQLAVSTALRVFLEARPDTRPSQLLWQMFHAANTAVYDANRTGKHAGSRMATTLLISLLRNDELNIGHIGDCRAYLVQSGKIRQMTSDHSYVGMQLKMGLIEPAEAETSDLRSVLTRSIGHERIVRVDYYNAKLTAGDRVIQCSDGMYRYVTEREFCEVASIYRPEDACRVLIDLAMRRKGDDNISVQVAAVESIESVSYYRGVPVYRTSWEHASVATLEVGTTLDGRYQIEDVIDRSGTATIYKATDLKTNQLVALKDPNVSYQTDPAAFARYQREEEIGLRLRHPQLLQIHETEGKKSRPYTVMEFLQGQTLGHLMRMVHPLPVRDALKLAGRICEVLEYMDGQGVVHGGLMPDKVMICTDGTIRVMGLGRWTRREGKRLRNGGPGTDYVAPEQVKGHRGDGRTDVYSLGAMLYHMVTGRPPFAEEHQKTRATARVTGDPVSPRRLNPQVSPEVEEIILRAMDRNPAKRYESAAEMKSDLDQPGNVRVTGRAERLKIPTEWDGGPWWSSDAVIIAALVAAVLGAIVWLARQPWL